MKPKAVVFLVVFCLALGFLVVDGLCTTAKKVSRDGKEIRHFSKEFYPPENMDAAARVGRYSAFGSKDEADCYNLIPDVEVPAVTEHEVVGLTWYEYQKNGSMGRMISVTSAALGGYRHVSWMWTAGDYLSGFPRDVYARSKPLAGVWNAKASIDLVNINCGYSNQTHMHDGNSVVIYHSTALFGGKWSSLCVADGPGSALYGRYWDLPDDMPDGASGEVGAWPKCEVLYCLDETVHPEPLDYFHIVENEGNTAPNTEGMIGYLRCYIDPEDINNLKCQTPTTGGEVYNIAAGATFQDEVYSAVGFSSCDISPIVVTGRGIVCKRVAIPFMPLVTAGDCNDGLNVGYIQCCDNGDDWIDGDAWPPTTQTIVNYAGTNERAFHDLSACFDYEDSLHIVWTTTHYDPSTPGSYYPGIARMYHWSMENGVSIIASKIQEGANPSAHNLNLSKMSISPKDPIYHPGGDSTYLFCIWTQVDSSDQNAAGDRGNQDLFGTGSFDGGNTWGKVLNLTGTHTPGCLADACVSEHWPSMADNMLNGDLHIEYICDRDAGGAIMDEGAWTENYTMYMRLPEWIVEPGPRGDYKLNEPPHWYHPPIKVMPNQTRTIWMTVFSIGNEDLTYSVESDHPCIQVSVPPSQLAPKESVEVSVLLDGTGACNGTFIAGHVILWFNEAGGTTHELPVHAVVADDYYECPRDPATVDTVDNGVLEVRLNANCQMEMDDIGTVPDTALEVFFKGGTIVATTQGADTLVGRWMGDNDLRSGAQDTLRRCDVDWTYPFWYISTKEIFIEATHLLPPAHLKWWWWEMAKGVIVFKPDRSDTAKMIVIQHVTVKRQDPPSWWPDLTPFTNYEDTYIGMAWDIDCPYDSSGGPEPFVGDESACNEGGYDSDNHIAWLRGFGRDGEHPEYNDYYAGIALADIDTPLIALAPYTAKIVKNNQYLYPTSPWGWKDGELCQLAGTPGIWVQDEDSLVDRSIVLSAQKIDAGTDVNRTAYFTVVHAIAPGGGRSLDELQAYVQTARQRAILMTEDFCGDVNDDGIVNVGDVVYVVGYLYKGGPVPVCPANRGDVNDDGIINVGDVVYLVGYLYKSGPPPVCWGMWYWR